LPISPDFRDLVDQDLVEVLFREDARRRLQNLFELFVGLDARHPGSFREKKGLANQKLTSQFQYFIRGEAVGFER
jgi:hypothetical protein